MASSVQHKADPERSQTLHDTTGYGTLVFFMNREELREYLQHRGAMP